MSALVEAGAEALHPSHGHGCARCLISVSDARAVLAAALPLIIEELERYIPDNPNRAGGYDEAIGIVQYLAEEVRGG